MSTSFHYNGTVCHRGGCAKSFKTSSTKLQDSHAQALPVTQQALPSTQGFCKKPGCMAQPSEAVTSLVYVRLTLQQAWDECGGDDFVIPKCKGTNIINDWLKSKVCKAHSCHFISGAGLPDFSDLVACLFCCSELGQRFCEFRMYTLEITLTVLHLYVRRFPFLYAFVCVGLRGRKQFFLFCSVFKTLHLCDHEILLLSELAQEDASRYRIGMAYRTLVVSWHWLQYVTGRSSLHQE